MKVQWILVIGATIASLALGVGLVLAQPEIRDVQVTDVTEKSATIVWATNEFGDSMVNYGTSAEELNASASDPILLTSHSVILTDLLPGTEYFFETQSTGPGGTSTDDNGGDLYSFTTADEAIEETEQSAAGGRRKRKGFVGTVDGQPNDSVNLILQGKGEAQTILLPKEYKLKQPGGAKAGEFG